MDLFGKNISWQVSWLGHPLLEYLLEEEGDEAEQWRVDNQVVPELIFPLLGSWSSLLSMEADRSEKYQDSVELPSLKILFFQLKKYLGLSISPSSST